MHFVEKKGRGDCKGSVQIVVNSSSIVKLIIIMKICKALTPQLKAQNEHDTYNVYQAGECYPQFNKS